MKSTTHQRRLRAPPSTGRTRRWNRSLSENKSEEAASPAVRSIAQSISQSIGFGSRFRGSFCFCDGLFGVASRRGREDEDGKRERTRKEKFEKVREGLVSLRSRYARVREEKHPIIGRDHPFHGSTFIINLASPSYSSQFQSHVDHFVFVDAHPPQDLIKSITPIYCQIECQYKSEIRPIEFIYAFMDWWRRN